MGLFSASPAPQFNASIPTINQGMNNTMLDDTNRLRQFATNPITGLSQAGLAQQDFANKAFAQQRDQMQNSLLSNQASGQAQMARYGADSGSSERLAQSLGRDSLFSGQRLGAQQATSLADLAQNDMQGQQDRQFTALSALPQISQSQFTNQFNMDSARADALNAQNAINMNSVNSAKDRTSNLWGSILGLGGAALGGPVGAGLGKGIAGLFTKN
jgi:hypothetical protein